MLCLHLLAFKWDPASLLPPAKAQASFKHERRALLRSYLTCPVCIEGWTKSNNFIKARHLESRRLL